MLPLERYSGSSMGNLPIGQGIAVTPMQMATAYAAIANGGVLRAAHMIESVGGRAARKPAGHRVISEATASSLRRMLEGVLGPGGTASGAAIPGYVLAGKTGTAEKPDPITGGYSETKYVSSFVGFAPGQAAEAARRGDGRRAAGRDLRRPRRRPGVPGHHELRAELPQDPAGPIDAGAPPPRCARRTQDPVVDAARGGSWRRRSV